MVIGYDQPSNGVEWYHSNLCVWDEVGGGGVGIHFLEILSVCYIIFFTHSS